MNSSNMHDTHPAERKTGIAEFAFRTNMTAEMAIALLFNLDMLTRAPDGRIVAERTAAEKGYVVHIDADALYITEAGLDVISSGLLAFQNSDTLTMLMGDSQIPLLSLIVEEYERLHGDDYKQVLEAEIKDPFLHRVDNMMGAAIYGVTTAAVALARWLQYPSAIDPRKALLSA
jgi:hypothetical protein